MLISYVRPGVAGCLYLFGKANGKWQMANGKWQMANDKSLPVAKTRYFLQII
jgi:hypothetical protein